MVDPLERAKRVQKKTAEERWQQVQEQRDQMDKEAQPQKKELPESQQRIQQVALRSIGIPKSSRS